MYRAPELRRELPSAEDLSAAISALPLGCAHDLETCHWVADRRGDGLGELTTATSLSEVALGIDFALTVMKFVL